MGDELSLQRMKSLSESQRALELERKLFSSERLLKQVTDCRVNSRNTGSPGHIKLQLEAALTPIYPTNSTLNTEPNETWFCFAL